MTGLNAKTNNKKDSFAKKSIERIKFADLVRIISMIANINKNPEINIKNSYLRSNIIDKHSYFGMDLSTLIGNDINLNFTVIKESLEQLKSINNDKVTMMLNHDGYYFTDKDKHNQVYFKKSELNGTYLDTHDEDIIYPPVFWKYYWFRKLIGKRPSFKIGIYNNRIKYIYADEKNVYNFNRRKYELLNTNHKVKWIDVNNYPVFDSVFGIELMVIKNNESLWLKSILDINMTKGVTYTIIDSM
jgi:hypothetical protein